MNDEELKLAYFAGLFDGEGHIGFLSNGKLAKKTPVVQVKMTCHKTILAISEHFRLGSVQPNKPGRPHYKPQWKWRVKGADAVHVLTLVRKYLITKADDAQWVLDCLPTSRGSRQFAPRPAESFAGEES